jgi:hypothetical protein
LNFVIKDLEMQYPGGVSKNESVKISGKEKESDSITAIRSDDVIRECSGMVRFKE